MKKMKCIGKGQATTPMEEQLAGQDCHLEQPLVVIVTLHSSKGIYM